MRHTPSQSTPNSEPSDVVSSDLVRLWLCRAILRTQIRHAILEGDSEEGKRSARDTVLHALGFDSRSSGGTGLESQIKELSIILEAKTDLEDGTIFRNVKLLGRRLGLSELDQRLLVLRVLLRLSEGLWALLAGMIKQWTDLRTFRILGAILAVPESAIERALSPEGTLVRSGLLTVDEMLTDHFVEKIHLHVGLINALSRPHRTISSLMSFLVSPARPGTLVIADYPHLKEEIALAIAYLKAAGTERRKGVNLLLHGAPGTGKTELACTIAKALGWTLYDIHGKQIGQRVFDGRARLGGLLMAQGLLRRSRRSAILFDEIEDVLNPPKHDDNDAYQIKQFVNQFMEDNPTPTFWITNNPGRLDAAYLRRFDLVIAVDEPPRSVKRKILADACEGIEVSSAWLDRQADVPRLTPALISRMTQVARLATNDESEAFTASFQLLRDQHFRARQSRFEESDLAQPLEYDLAAVNASCDPAGLARQLRQVGMARLLFHGAPGTGKTAYARELAREIDRPLQPKLASDLLAPHLGETEQRIREAFAQARRDSAVLLLDEADSFLQRREHAVRSWEITQVNEFLSQLERFNGVVVCTTNFLDTLDAAAMRRFDVKVEFRYLRPDQRIRLFENLCQRLAISILPDELPEIETRLNCMHTLTPGDYATVSRLIGLVQEHPDALGVVTALSEEQRYKAPASGKSIGFVA